MDAQTSKTKRIVTDIQQRVLRDGTAGSQANPLIISAANVAGLLLKPYLGDVNGLKMQSATPFEWSEASEASQADQHLPHMWRHIAEVKQGDKYIMIDARQSPKLFFVTG